MTVFATLIIAPLAGCVSLDPASLSTKTAGEICYAWAVARAGNGPAENGDLAFAELQRRGEISNKDLVAIKAFGKPMVGMSEQAAVCAWGGMFDAVNTTTTAGGVTKQYVSRSDYRATRYFYTRNGIVTATQD